MRPARRSCSPQEVLARDGKGQEYCKGVRPWWKVEEVGETELLIKKEGETVMLKQSTRGSRRKKTGSGEQRKGGGTVIFVGTNIAYLLLRSGWRVTVVEAVVLHLLWGVRKDGTHIT